MPPDPFFPRLRVRSGGRSGPVLLLLHGLGATSDVWRPFEPVLAAGWPGRWLAPDLPGHGGSPPLPVYAVGTLAAAVAAGVAAERGDGGVAVLGHSLGGAVGMALASGWYGTRVDAVVGLGVKTVWSEEEVARGRSLAARPPQVLPDRDAALERHLRVAGLTGLTGPDHPASGGDDAVVQVDGGWRPALDPAAFAVSLAGLARGLLAAATAPVLLARGEHDPMAGPQDAARLGVPGLDLPGLGHNAHVEDPAAVWTAVRGALGAGS